MADAGAIQALRAQVERLQGRRLDVPVLPVPPALADLLPGGGLRPGSSYALGRSTSLLFALLARPSQSGAWCAAVGMPHLGAEAARAAGIGVAGRWRAGAALTIRGEFSIVIAGLCLLAARQLFKGKQWARALLTAGSIVLVAMGITAALVLFAGGSPAGAPAQADPIPNFIDLAASFCAGLFAGTALWQLYTKDSTAFFQERSGVGKS